MTDFLEDVIKTLIATLDDITFNKGHPGYSDSELSYNCPQCSCKDCYRVSCEFNNSELFKKLYKEC